MKAFKNDGIIICDRPYSTGLGEYSKYQDFSRMY